MGTGKCVPERIERPVDDRAEGCLSRGTGLRLLRIGGRSECVLYKLLEPVDPLEDAAELLLDVLRGLPRSEGELGRRFDRGQQVIDVVGE